MIEDSHGMINTVRDEMFSVIDEHFRIMRAELEASWPRACKVPFKEFYVCGAPRFMVKEGAYHHYTLDR